MKKPFIIEKARFSYVHIFEPQTMADGRTQFGVSLIISKDDVHIVEGIRAAIAAAYLEGKDKLKGSGFSVPSLENITSPLHDGDVKRPQDNAYANSWFINAKSPTQPEIVDRDCRPITDPLEVYSGIIGRASVNFAAYSYKGNKGISCWLNNLQKLEDAPRLGGKTSAMDDFGAFLGK